MTESVVSYDETMADFDSSNSEPLHRVLSVANTNRLGKEAIGSLWTPGDCLDAEYPVPTNEELCELFSEYRGGMEASPTEGVFGVFCRPNGPIRGIASIDVDDVLRDSMKALHIATGIPTGSTDSYSRGTWFDQAKHGVNYRQSVIFSVLQATVDVGLVPPPEGIDRISATVQKWRQNGILCVANTSTMPGCEPGTIRYTLGRDMPDCFDAILFPRNYDGQGTTTKAAALGALVAQLGLDISAKPLVHIDDTEHHITAFQAAYPDHQASSRLGLFAPLTTPQTGLTEEICCLSPLEAFERADSFLQKRLEEGLE